MANTIKIKRGPSSSLSTITLQDGEMAFTTDTKKLYISNTDEPINNNTTYSISKSGSTITLTGSDGSKTTVSDSNTTYGEATTSANGLMTSTMVSKLNGIATGANKTTVDSALSSTSTNPVQNKVINTALASKADASAIPTKTSQLTNDSGFKTTDNNTTYTLTQDSSDGHKITLTPSSGTATTIIIPDNNTTYSNMTAATSSAAGKAGLVPAPGAGKQASFLRGDGAWVVPTNTTYSNMTGATSSAAGAAGLVPAPAAGKQASFLRGDGTWVVPTNTTYNAATTSAAGLMSAADKTKLDGITASADTVSFTRSLTSGTKIGTITINGTGTDLYCQTDTNTTYSAATTSASGLMTADMVTKLNGIATGANKYSHPTSSGNKHIPAGGASGQILRWSADGTAVWGADSNTTYSVFGKSGSSASAGLVPAPSTTAGATKYLREDGTWQTPPDTNTTYSVATQSANGLMSAADKKTLDGMTATTTTPKAAGTAAVGSETKYARGDHVHPAQTTVSGNAGSATKLATARNFTIGKTAKSFNGTAAVSWSLDEIGSNVYVGTTAPSDADVDVWIDPSGAIDLSALWNSVYPVGSIYMSVNSTNPGTLFSGTTWTQLTDRFLLGAGSTYSNGATGGSANTTLTTANLPSHTHSFSATSGNQSANHTHSLNSHTHTIPAMEGSTNNPGDHTHLVTTRTTSYGQGSQSAWRCLSWTGTNSDWEQHITSGGGGGHTHTVSIPADTYNTGKSSGSTGSNSANHTHSVSGTTGSAGSGTSFTNLPPYLVVYMWKRTA